MANVNYYVTPTTYVVNSGENWGEQDIDNDASSDGGILPLEMKIYADPDYNVDASYFTIKGYEPTSIGINGERIWEQGLTTTDASGNEVTNIQLGGEFTNDVNKVEIYNISDENTSSSIWPNGVFDSGNSQWCLSLPTIIGNSDLPWPTDSPLKLGFYWGGTIFSYLGFTFIPQDVIYPDDNTNLQPGDNIGAFYLENDQYIFAGGRGIGSTSWPGGWGFYQRTSSSNRGFEIGQEIHFFIFRDELGNRKTYKVEFEFTTLPSFSIDPSENGFQAPTPLLGGGGTDACSSPAAENSGRVVVTGINSIVLYQDEEAEGGYFGAPIVNSVGVKAWLNSTYSIVGSNDIQLHLDIDGDAQPIVVEPEQSDTQFSITLKLKEGENSNAIIEANTSFYGDTFDDISIPRWFVEAVNIDDHTAKLLFTKNAYYSASGGYGAPYVAPLMFGAGGTDVSFRAFIIKPKNGYSVCKDNFWVETVGDYTTNTDYTYSGPNTYQGSNPVFGDQFWWRINESGNVNVNRFAAFPSGQLNSTNSDIYWLGYQYGSYGNQTEYTGLNPALAIDRVKNYKLGIEDNDVVSYVNSNSILNAPNTLVSGSFELLNSFLYDTQEGVLSDDDYGNILSSNAPWTWDANYPIRTSSLLNPIDWTGNIVIISLDELEGYQPEYNLQTGTSTPKNFVIEIEGSAMEIQTGDMPSVNINGLITEKIN